ncbi:MAG: DUF2029 domain-containing protein [Deltaproteobacteria bacterium]|nr:DUF2029 domain-containing protein [Deltaproteobacteria bacterium]
MSSRAFLALAALLAVVALAPLGELAFIPGIVAELPRMDFIEYWGAAKLLVSHQNPYDASIMATLQAAAGRTEPVVMMWNPPWALAFVLPLAALPLEAAHALWLIVQLGALGLACARLWRRFCGAPELRPLAVAMPIAFLPVFSAMLVGQVAPLLLLGVALFLDCSDENRDVSAGLALALIAVKPHALLLLGLAVGVQALRERRWRLIVSSAVALAVLAGLASIFDPHVLAQYADVMLHHGPAQYRPPTLGYLLRLAVAPHVFAVQFVPVALGLAWLARQLWVHGARWSWRAQLSPLILVSLLTSPYGAWPFDLVLLLVPTLEIASGLARGTDTRGRVLALGFLALNAFAAVRAALGADYLEFVWLTPAITALYAIGRSQLQGPPTVKPAAA